ncbi:Spermatogenesis-associated protein 20 [Venturia nashicola]|nr:Spermatogenesis-associated protein 20 [Venturia nashicola]
MTSNRDDLLPGALANLIGDSMRSSGEDQHGSGGSDGNGTDTESVHTSSSPLDTEETPASNERNATDPEETPPTDPVYDAFITQAQGRLQDRPLATRVSKAETRFMDQAIAEIRTLRERVATLEGQGNERELDMTAVFDKLNEIEEENERLRKTCDEAEIEYTALMNSVTEMGAILHQRKK